MSAWWALRPEWSLRPPGSSLRRSRVESGKLRRILIVKLSALGDVAHDGPGHRVLPAPMPCTAGLRKRCDRDVECRESIPPGDVAAAAAGLIGAPEQGGKRKHRNPGG